MTFVGSCQVKYSMALGLRDRVAIIPASSFSSSHPYASYGDLIGLGRRRYLSEAACYCNWPHSRLLIDALTESQQRMA